MLQSNRNRLMQIWKMSYMVIFLSLFAGITTDLGAQSVVNRNECGENAFIQSFIRGVDGTNVPNVVSAPQIDGFMRAYAEVWITSNECDQFPNVLELTSDSGEVVEADFTNIVDPGGSERERIYRAVFDDPLTSYEVTGFGICDDVVSMTLSVESFLENSSSFLAQFNRELDGTHDLGGDDCLSFSLNIGVEEIDREFIVSLPIHEKDRTNSNRTVSYTITAGSNIVSDTRNEQNAGPEAAFYETTITVPANESIMTIEVCSPQGNGDSFGIGAIVVASTECPSCEPQPDIAINAVSDSIICLGSSVSLSANTSGGFGQCEIQWQRRVSGQPWTNFANGQTSISVGTGFLSTVGIYDIRAIYTCDGLTCDPSTSNRVRIEVLEDPSVNIEANLNEICIGQTVNFSVDIDGGVGNCQLINESRVGTSGPWQTIGSNINFSQSSIFDNPGTYQFRSRYNCSGPSCGEDISDVVTVVVRDEPGITIQADDTEVCLGESVELTASESGGIGQCAIQWQRRPQGGTWTNVANGQTTITAGTGFLSAPGVFQYRALYDCDGPSCNEDVSNVVSITVAAQPEITIEADDTQVCLGEVVNFTPSVSGGAGNCAIQWERRVGTSGPWIETSNGNAGTFFLNAPGLYQYRALYNCCLLYTSPSPRDRG